MGCCLGSCFDFHFGPPFALLIYLPCSLQIHRASLGPLETGSRRAGCSLLGFSSALFLDGWRRKVIFTHGFTGLFVLDWSVRFVAAPAWLVPRWVLLSLAVG